MIIQTMKILTKEETELVVRALEMVATEEFLLKEEIATVKKILRSLEKQEPRKSEFEGIKRRLLADVCLIPNWA